MTNAEEQPIDRAHTQGQPTAGVVSRSSQATTAKQWLKRRRGTTVENVSRNCTRTTHVVTEQIFLPKGNIHLLTKIRV
jgi:hypothetical protein